MNRDTTYARSAEKDRKDGIESYNSARGDALGELYCDECGYKRAGKPCRECNT